MKHRAFAITLVACATLSTGIARADVPNEDTSPPEVVITEPAMGASYDEAPATITITATATDPDSGVSAVRASVDGEALAELTAEPYTWEDVDLAAGSHVIVVEADNGDGYPGTASVTVTVNAGGADESAGATAGDDGAGATAGDAGTGAPSTTGSDGNSGDGDGGCASVRPRSLVGSGIAFAIAVIAGLALRRRR